MTLPQLNTWCDLHELGGTDVGVLIPAWTQTDNVEKLKTVRNGAAKKIEVVFGILCAPVSPVRSLFWSMSWGRSIGVNFVLTTKEQNCVSPEKSEIHRSSCEVFPEVLCSLFSGHADEDQQKARTLGQRNPSQRPAIPSKKHCGDRDEDGRGTNRLTTIGKCGVSESCGLQMAWQVQAAVNIVLTETHLQRCLLGELESDCPTCVWLSPAGAVASRTTDHLPGRSGDELIRFCARLDLPQEFTWLWRTSSLWLRVCSAPGTHEVAFQQRVHVCSEVLG